MSAEPYRENLIISIGLLPILTGLGHLTPSLGGAMAAVGKPVLDLPVLTMTCSSTVLVDAYDKYRDVPLNTRGVRWACRTWFAALILTMIYSSHLCGFETALRLQRFLAIGMLWGSPCVPMYTAKWGLKMVKPKRVFGEAKSVVVAVCMGYVDADVGAFHACLVYPDQCRSTDVHMRALAFGVLYNWLRETIFDTRDIREDAEEKLHTLPVTLGRLPTIMLVAIVGFVGDAIISQRLDLESATRVFTMLVLCLLCLRFPRESGSAWGSMALLGLGPAWWGQARL